MTLAAAVLLALAWRTGTLRTLRGRWRWLLAYAVAEVTIPFPLIAAGEQRVSSSLAAILIASVPLIGALLALRFDHAERPTPIRAVGLAVGFGGVIVLMGINVAGSSRELLGTGMILIAAVGYAIGPMLIKHRFADLDPRATIGASLAIAAVLLTPLAVLDPPRVVPSAGAIASVIVLGLLCTAAAFVIFAVLIREAGTSRATVITYVNPVIAVALGVTLLGRAPRRGRGRRPAVDPRRLVAVDRRAAAAGHRRVGAPPGVAPGVANALAPRRGVRGGRASACADARKHRSWGANVAPCAHWLTFATFVPAEGVFVALCRGDG